MKNRSNYEILKYKNLLLSVLVLFPIVSLIAAFQDGKSSLIVLLVVVYVVTVLVVRNLISDKGQDDHISAFETESQSMSEKVGEEQRKASLSQSGENVDDKAFPAGAVNVGTDEGSREGDREGKLLSEEAKHPHAKQLGESTNIYDPPSYQQRETDLNLFSITIGNQVLSVNAYSRSVFATVSELVEIIIAIFKRSHSAIYRTEQMVKQVDSTFDVLDGVKSIADETSLIALNVYFDSAASGHAGASSMSLASEVKKLSDHALKFTEDIRKEVNVANKAINEVKELISRTADKELQLTLSSKETIDQEISRLKTIEAIIDRCGLGDSVETSAYLSEAKKALLGAAKALSDLNGRVKIIMSKRAVSKEEAIKLEPILRMSQQLVNVELSRIDKR